MVKIDIKKRHMLFLICVIAILGLGFVLATWSGAGGVGHSFDELETCGSNNQILKMSNGAWVCGDAGDMETSVYDSDDNGMIDCSIIEGGSDSDFCVDDGGASGDNLGNHIASQALNMNNKRLYNAGYVSIGSSSVETPLFIEGSHVSGGGLLLVNAPSTDAFIMTNSPNDKDSGISFKASGNVWWNIYNSPGRILRVTNGDNQNGVYMQQGSTSWISNSDRRLKENIKKIPNALERIETINGVTFNFKGSSNSEVGVIAQDVNKEFPEIVSSDGEYLGVQYSRLSPILIEAIKELKLQNDALKEIVCEDHPLHDICKD